MVDDGELRLFPPLTREMTGVIIRNQKFIKVTGGDLVSGETGALRALAQSSEVPGDARTWPPSPESDVRRILPQKVLRTWSSMTRS